MTTLKVFWGELSLGVSLPFDNFGSSWPQINENAGKV